ncbi:hypothetical protein K457DRAFT_138163 [Linnemannia elongata AG-77]|uniref:Uncharacterized protein n=1 Tax=Linnemannia elongata AG-77 TaxID=1314771 RepID=A0A197JXZ3_9FUNG|nr:hypothetical protein K457DRAFT_138163 [Linnemannia elongata AG-77]
MSIPTFVSTLPGSTRQFLGNLFHKKDNGLRIQQQQSQAPSPNNPTSTSTSTSTSFTNNNNNDINDSIAANNSLRNEKVAESPLPIMSTFLEKYPSTLGSNSTSSLSVLLPPVSILADNFDYNYHSNRTSNTSSRGNGTGTALGESSSTMPIPPPRRSSIGTNTSSSSAGSATAPSIASISGSGSSVSPAPTHTHIGPKSPSPLSPRGDNNTSTRSHVTVTFTKFIKTPTIPAHALTVSTAPTITTTNNNNNNNNSGFDLFIVNKDDSTEDVVLDMEVMSPTSRKKKFDHFPFRRSRAAATATNGGGSGSGGGVGAGSILGNLASSFKKQHNNNTTSSNSNNKNNNHLPSKHSVGFTPQQQQQAQQQNHHQKIKWQQEQQQSYSQPPQQQQQQTLKSPRSQLFFITGRNKKESLRPSTSSNVSSKRFSSSSPSLIPNVPSLPATDTNSPAATTIPITVPTTKTAASKISYITSPTRATAALKKKRLSKNQPNITTSAATVTPTLVPAPVPVTVTKSDIVPSPLSMMHWPILPEVVEISNLPEYIPYDSIGLNAKRNEMYARARLVALREHQQVLVGLLFDLLALDRQRREQQSMFKDSAHSVEKATVTAASRKNTRALMSASQATALTTNNRKVLKDAEASMAADCGCDCQKRRRRLIQKHDSAIRAYQQAILDLWQMDQNLCHWLSRYIRTTRHVGRGLNYMLTAMAENSNINNNATTVSGSTSSPFKYPVALGMTQEIGSGVRSIDVETSGNDHPSFGVSGVSNPELERMGILQSRLLSHSTTDRSLKKSGPGCSEHRSPPTFRATVSKEFAMESTTLGLIDAGSPSVRPSDQTVPVIKVNSPELLLKPLPKLPENNDTTSNSRRTSITSITPSFITADGFPGGVVATMRRRRTMRENRLVTGPILSQAIRELVTSSAPISPPPAIPAPKRPKPPTFPINIPSSTRANAVAGIVSTSFFPTVPSPPASSRIAHSRTRPSCPTHLAFSAPSTTSSSEAGVVRPSDSLRSPISTLAPILELDQGDQQSQPLSLLQPCESDPSRNSITSGSDLTIVNTHTKEVKDNIKPRSATATSIVTTTATTLAPAPASSAATTTMPINTTLTDSATTEAIMMIPDTDDYNEIEASVFVGYHLQSLSKANEFLKQFNKESQRSHAVLQRFEAAKRGFERHVLGRRRGIGGASVGGGEDSDGEMSGQHW